MHSFICKSPSHVVCSGTVDSLLPSGSFFRVVLGCPVPWSLSPSLLRTAAGTQPEEPWGTADVRGAGHSMRLSPRVFVASGKCLWMTAPLGHLWGTWGPRTRVLQVILRTASRSTNSEDRLRQPQLSKKANKHFKHKIFFYLSTKATRDHFWFCFYAFFFSRRYLHLHLFTALLVFTQSRIKC